VVVLILKKQNQIHKGVIKLKKKLMLSLFMVIILTMFATLAGCTGNKQDGAEQKQEASEPANKDIILATTTSTQDSGLLDVLVPMFEEQTGYLVKTIAVGTGAALEMGAKGNADVLLVHAPDAEKPLVDSGVGINYQLVMHNDFVLLGPNSDPVVIKGTVSVTDSFKKIADNAAAFVSRGDDSGTHKKELALWKNTGIDPTGRQWYQETGQGMGATIAVANEKQGYTLSDRATYLAQAQNIDMQIVSEGDEDLMNIYHVMNINPEKFAELNINAEGGKAFVDFMIHKDTQKTISAFGVDKYGSPLFFADRL